jgi:hypothetical protein
MIKARRTTPAGFAVIGAITVAVLSALPGIAHAAGAGYYVIQCADFYRATPDIEESGSGNYIKQNKCQGSDAQLQITNGGGAVINQGAQYTMTAPPGTSIVEIHLDANLRRGSGHHAEIAVSNGSSVIPLVVGPDSNPTWQHYDFGGLDHPQLILRLYCTNATCPADGQAHVYARNITLLLADHSDPAITGTGGSLLSSGWERGSRTLSASAADLGAGVSGLRATVNATQVAAAGSCNTGGLGFPYTGPIVPCAPSASLSQPLNTAAAPFHNGANELRLTAGDYPGNQADPITKTVFVDNAPPSVAFSNQQDPASPETIRAPVSDAHSGVASATIQMRAAGTEDWESLETKLAGNEARSQIDSLSAPAGDYEFRAVVSDVAGNLSVTTKRANGEPMKLHFPLKDPVELDAHLNRGGSKAQVVRYGTKAKAKGLLLDRSGHPVADQPVTITEYFGAGALLRERVSEARTDERGKWRSKIPAGPSRDVRVAYGGSSRYAPAAKGVGTFLVRSRASFQTSRENIPEGRTLAFTGRVGHFGARIPSGGKLVELQVRVRSGRWDTVGEAFRTNERGYYRRTYRFGHQYAQDTQFKFRVKVRREARWPYKRTNTVQRKVIVRAK